MWGVANYLPGIELGEALRIIVAALVALDRRILLYC